MVSYGNNERNVKMSEKIREDLSYSVWGETKNYDESKFSMEMNSKWGKGFMIGFSSDIGINTSLSTYHLDFDAGETISKNLYKENLFCIGKVIKGQYFIKEKMKNSILFNENDIFCFSGNYFLNSIYHNKEECEILCVFGYNKEIINYFKTRKWYTDKIKNILNDSDLRNGIVLFGTNELDKILSDLYGAIKNEDRFSVYAKSIHLFHYFTDNYNKKIYKRSKTYTDEQVETVIKIKEFLDNNLDTYYPMPKIAEMFNISLSRMQSIFSDYYKMSPYRYHLNIRLEEANDLIINTDVKIITIAKMLGFTSYNKFSAAYKNKYNCNPSKHRMS